MEYYIRRRNGLMGPFDLETLKEKILSNQLQNFDEIGESRKGPWKSLKDLNLFVPTPLLNLPHNETIATPPPGQTDSNFASQSPISGTSLPTPEILYNRVPPGMSGPKVEWYYRAEDGEPGPPVSEKEIRSMIKRGDLDKGFYVWNDSMENWEPIQSIFNVDFRIKQNRSTIKGTIKKEDTSNNSLQNTEFLLIYDNHKKSPVLAYLLFIFLNSFGAHAFYLGEIGRGIGWFIMSILFGVDWYILFNDLSGRWGENPVNTSGHVFFIVFYFFIYIVDLITLNKRTTLYNYNLRRKLKG